MKTKFDFKITDENQNDNGYAYSLNGMDLTEFVKNPVCLFNHDSDNAIGLWENLKLTVDNSLVGTAVLDDTDEEALKIASKINKGIINGCSTGAIAIEINGYPVDEYYNKGLYKNAENTIITKSILKEVSITPIPSNTNSRQLYIQTQDGLKLMKFNNVKELHDSLAHAYNNEKINNELKNMDTEKKEDAVEVVVNEVVETEVKKVETEVKEVVETVITNVNTENTNPILTDSLNSFNNEKLELTTKLNDSILQNSILQDSLNKLQNEFNQFKTDTLNKEIDLFLNDSVKMGYIKHDQLNDFKFFALKDFNKTKEMILKMERNNPNSILKDTFKIKSDRDDWSFIDWSKKDSLGLEEMRINDPQKWKELFNRK